MMIIGILPTLTEQLLNGEALSRQPALQAAQRADLRRARGGPGDQHRRRRAAGDPGRHDRPRGGVHERAAAPDGRPGGVRRALERGAGDRRRAAGDRRQLAVLLRARAVARDADRALRADHRHAPGGAQGPGRAPARVVRRALDHVDLRPLRGERPLLPGAAAGGRGRGPDRRAGERRRAEAAGAAAAQRHDLPLEPARSTTSPAGARTCAWRTACCRPGRRSSTRSPTPPSTTGSCACWSRTSGRSGRRCRSRPPTTTSTRARRTASTRACTGPAWARRPATELVLRRLLPMARDGLARWGVDAADADRLLEIIERRCVEQRQRRLVAGRGLPPPLRPPRPRRRPARDDRPLPRAHALQRAGPHLAALSRAFL